MLKKLEGVFEEWGSGDTGLRTAMLCGYLRYGFEDEALRYGFEDEALRLLSWFLESGVVANAKMLVCVLNLCSRRADFELGRVVHSEDAFMLFSRMLSDGFAPNEFTVWSVLKACGEEKALKFGK
ncbi:pentatricopeptide repeat-containing protein [Tanacetum coccineum]